MKFQQISVPTIKEVFITTIEKMILSGDLAIGQKLPSERELAAQMQISKTIVHDGLKELERSGFVQAVSNRGTFVADYLASGSIEILNAIIRYNNDRVDKKTQASMMELRLAVEPDVLKAFVDRAKEEDFRQLEELMKQIQEVPKGMENQKEFAEVIYQYHLFIMVKSGNIIFPIIYNIFSNLAILLFRQFIEIYGREYMIECMETIHELIMKKEGKRAALFLQKEICRYGRDTSLNLHEAFSRQEDMV